LGKKLRIGVCWHELSRRKKEVTKVPQKCVPGGRKSIGQLGATSRMEIVQPTMYINK